MCDDDQLWYRLVINTVGLMATANLGQPYDFERACGVCGAGAVPVGPLFIDAKLMGKKALDATAHDQRIVVTRDLAVHLSSLGISGFECRPVAHKTETRMRIDERFAWLEATFEWPPMAPSSIVAREDQCTLCYRSGHFDSPAPPTEFRYAAAPTRATDFGATYEYFGRWRAPGKTAPDVGGGRLTLVSQKLREALEARKVRHVSFEQVRFVRRDV